MPGHSHAQLAGAGRRFGPSTDDAGLSWGDAWSSIEALAQKARDQATAMVSVYGAATPAEIEQAAAETYQNAKTQVSETAHGAIDALEQRAKAALQAAQDSAAAAAQEKLKAAAPWIVLVGGGLLVAVYFSAKQGSRRRAR